LTKRGRIEVTATVVRIVSHGDDDEPSYSPVLRYEVGGKRYEEEYSRSPYEMYNCGEKVQIYCRHKNHAKILMKKDKTRAGGTIMLLMIGFYMLYIGFFEG